jgi:sRNA-binding protein
LWETLTRIHNRPGRTQQTGIFCGKALLLTSSGARVQESKSKREQESKKKNKKAKEERKNKNKKARRTRKQEKEQEQESKRKNGKTPSLLRRIILRLGRITP